MVRLTLAGAALAASAAVAGSTSVDGVPRSFSFRSSPMDYELSAAAVPGEFCDPRSPSTSGYFGVDGSEYDANRTKRYFYWLFERRAASLLSDEERSALSSRGDEDDEDDDDAPLVIWLNGGPGCSSLLGLLLENGPCLIDDDGNSTRLNPHSWTEVAHVLYLDQPARAGFSYGDGSDLDQASVAEDAYYFLQSFLKSEGGSKFRDLPLVLAGESYAGHYIPAIAHRIRRGNREQRGGRSSDLLRLNLSGLAIGNGAFGDEEQMFSYPEMAYHNSQGIQLVDEAGYRRMKEGVKACARDIRECTSEGTSDAERAFLCQKAEHCEDVFFDPLYYGNVSYYDITKPCFHDVDPLCGDMAPITTFLNRPRTKEILGVPAHVAWNACADRPFDRWSDRDRVSDFAPYVAEALDDGVPVLVYSGDRDYICNYIGNRAVALNLKWKHGDDFRGADDRDWDGGGGEARSSHGLTFLRVHDAGHMVPQDQPERALRMIAQFLNGEAF